jgi:tetratricopeptide (TPR) repeat protein
MTVSPPQRYYIPLILLVLIASTFFSYWDVDKCDFISLDDHQYVLKNYHVMSGFNLKNVSWAFTSFDAANWHPLTWLSHMLDCSLYGDKPAGHHLTNLVLHIVNVLLLFFALKKMTGAVWRSALVAALFALHPLHVESVAWVSERKDVLSTFFLFLTLLNYAFFVSKKKRRFFYGALVSYACGLLAKPMIVTLPFLLLLLDFWPLKRLEAHLNSVSIIRFQWKNLLLLCIEKTPFFLLAIASSIITVFAQHAGNAIVKADEYSLLHRIANAVNSYATYIEKMFWPAHLSFFYPLPQKLPSLAGLGLACILLLLITGISLFVAKKRPYVLTGWFWFLGSLVPVIGIVQVGSQAMADRYTYVPLIGLFITSSWLFYDYTHKIRVLKIAAISISLLVLTLFSLQTRRQTGYWINDLALANHGLAVTKDNFLAYSIKGNALFDKNNYDEALFCFQKSLSYRPTQPSPRLNIGLILLRQKKPLQAIEVFNALLEEDSNNTLANLNCGNAYGIIGDTKSAITCFQRAISVDPNFTAALYNLGITYASIKEYPLCVQYLTEAVRTHPNDAESYYSLGKCCLLNNNFDDAIRWFNKSIDLVPNYPDSHRQLSEAYKKCGNPDFANKHYVIADSLERSRNPKNSSK